MNMIGQIWSAQCKVQVILSSVSNGKGTMFTSVLDPFELGIGPLVLTQHRLGSDSS